MDFLDLLKDFFEAIGQEGAVPYVLGLMLLIAAFLGGRKALIWFQTRRLQQHLRPYYDDDELREARRFYVETQCQNIPPSTKDEIRESTTVRKPIIRYFMREAFPPPGDGRKFYLVLGGSGTGKTTFMINLCYRYLSQWWGKHYDIRLLPISHPDTPAEIQQIKEAGKAPNTLLLLDALDEDRAAAEDFTGRMNALLESVAPFKDVVITCRTQFVPNEQAIPGEVQIRKFGSKPGYHTLEVLYISPFNHRDVQRFLRKKFGWVALGKKRKRKQKAQAIVAKAPNLMARPMLLGNIDLLLDDPNRQYEHLHEIYDVMIDRWLQREADRRFEDGPAFKAELRRFSQALAIRIYQQWRENGQLHLDRETLLSFAQAFAIQLEAVDMESKSLLNKDPLGNLKFAHKSILEYFIALHAREDPVFYYTRLEFEGMDVARQFCEEMGLSEHIFIPMVRVEGGTFQMGEGKAQHDVSLDSFEIGKYPLTQRQWKAIMGENNNPSHFRGDDLPVEQVSWEDVQVYLTKLNKKTGLHFRLPTEAEWEYAAGGGSRDRTIWAGTSDEKELADYAWYVQNSDQKTHPVGQKKPNALGLYDMSGNVWEGCQDGYGDYPSAPQVNPSGPERGDIRVGRGGSWDFDAASARASYRDYWHPDFRYSDLGCRLARSI